MWSVPGGPVIVHLSLDLVDRLSAEVMRGFGAVPKRGAEVGGILMGTLLPAASLGEPPVVRIDDYEPVPCGYSRGPSYLLTGEEAAVFDETMSYLRANPGETVPVGYYRGDTRDGFALGPEDLELLEQYYPAAQYPSTGVALLIKPFVTKVSTAGIFVRDSGRYPETNPLEFPFRREELTGAEPPKRRSMMERGERGSAQRARILPREAPLGGQDAGYQSEAAEEPNSSQDSSASRAPGFSPSFASSFPQAETFAPAETPAYPDPRYGARPKKKRQWVWAPLSFIFLLLGVVLGFQMALSIGGKSASKAPADFALSLTVQRSGDNLDVRWNGQAPAIQAAQKGLLQIQDGTVEKPVELDPAQLHNGTLIYRATSDQVHFRLVVYPKPEVSVSEEVDWKR